jgi:two-component system response regulator MprA
VRLLVVDDDEAMRTLCVTLLKEVEGVGSVVAAADGAEAVQLGEALEFDLAVLDLNMPRLDGVETALRLTDLQPSLRIALQSADADALRQRAQGLDVAVFEKAELDRLVAWVGAEVERSGMPRSRARTGRRDLRCARCGYGIVSDDPPERCPMCGRSAIWASGWLSRR